MGLLIDGLIILLYFVAITAIGLWMGWREESLSDFAFSPPLAERGREWGRPAW